MKLFKYNQFINESNHTICAKYGITKYNFNSDGTIDVYGNVNLGSENLTKIPIKFNNVSGHFYCAVNNLTSLIGCPKSVGGNFSCFNNELTSLEDAPKSVGGWFDCSGNQLTSLEGCPKSVGKHFYCYNNKLTSLIGGPKYVLGSEYYCYNNQLTDFYGFPEDWEGYINFRGNPCQKILNLFPENKRCSAIDLLNEFEVIQGNKIYELRLEEVFRQLKLKMQDLLEDNVNTQYYLQEKGQKFAVNDKNLSKKY
jgi:hypothetical protein